ncbi:hypothetical protein Pint_12283 [Pistacia integerrima]|uniref:Uncharacterized protein n=1 Tax=Pistacia integerrima TaxID=434235 RepID=A0ACC0XLG9_9ROSI|nr:hypothetical protein Pint_12283 [Pistacia integerrima]
MLRFLSVSSSHYAEEDFISLLPRFLGSGLAAVSLSISAMMVVFCATIFIVFKDGMQWIPILVTVMAYFISFMFLEKVLIIIEDIVRFSNNNRSSLFKSSGEESF